MQQQDLQNQNNHGFQQTYNHQQYNQNPNELSNYSNYDGSIITHNNFNINQIPALQPIPGNNTNAIPPQSIVNVPKQTQNYALYKTFVAIANQFRGGIFIFFQFFVFLLHFFVIFLFFCFLRAK